MVILFWIIFSYWWQKQIKWPRSGWIYERRVLIFPLSLSQFQVFLVFSFILKGLTKSCFHISFVPFQLWGSCVNLFPISKNIYVHVLIDWVRELDGKIFGSRSCHMDRAPWPGANDFPVQPFLTQSISLSVLSYDLLKLFMSLKMKKFVYKKINKFAQKLI